MLYSNVKRVSLFCFSGESFRKAECYHFEGFFLILGLILVQSIYDFTRCFGGLLSDFQSADTDSLFLNFILI